MILPAIDRSRGLQERTWPADAHDDYFGPAFVDIDEWRDEPARHRYVHGGFQHTDTLFSFYFPEADVYERRFFQHVTPVPQSENLAQHDGGEFNKITFSVHSGAYYVETNGGGADAANPFSGMDLTIGAYRASAAAARFSRVVAAEVYGEHRPYGYLHGGSGGGYRTIGSSENTEGVWDGFVPYVIGSPMSIPNVFSVRMHAQRVLRDRFSEIVDAYDVGGDPASLTLSVDEAAALEEVTRMGFPPRSWFGWQSMGMHAFSVLYPGVVHADPTFADDFWSVEGYLGADPASSVHRDRVQLSTQITELLTGSTARGEELTTGGVDESYLHAAGGGVVSSLRLAEGPGGWMLGAQLIVTSGAAAGSVVRLASVVGAVVEIEPGQDDAVAALAVGDQVTLDNSTFLAAQTYHRHQVPGAEYAVWDQFRDESGAPVPPQRPMLLGPGFTQGAAGTVPTGRITGKMIVVACLLDREAFPWQADWYRSRVEEFLGDEAEERFRLWYIDNALHGDDDPQEFPTRSVSYVSALEAAQRQLSAWVERDVAPSPSTSYDIVDGQVVIPATAHERGGVQPVPEVTVNGSTSTTVRVGEPVSVRIHVVAPGDGVVVEIVADLDGSGELGDPIAFTPGREVSLEQVVAFDEPGTYFLAARVAAQAGGDVSDPHARIRNLARARVEVAR